MAHYGSIQKIMFGRQQSNSDDNLARYAGHTPPPGCVPSSHSRFFVRTPSPQVGSYYSDQDDDDDDDDDNASNYTSHIGQPPPRQMQYPDFQVCDCYYSCISVMDNFLDFIMNSDFASFLIESFKNGT